MTVSIVQSAGANNTPSSTTVVSGTLAAPATAGNCLVMFVAGDKNTGALTPPAGWSTLVELTSSSVSLYACFGTAAGGETSATVTLGSTGGGNGNTSWIVELADNSGAGSWGQAAAAGTNITSESTVTTTSTGTTGAASRAGLGLVMIAVDSAGNITSGTWTSTAFTNQYDAPNTSGVGGGGAGIHVGSAAVASAATSTSTWTTTVGSADQISGAIIVLSRSVSSPVLFPAEPLPLRVELDAGGVWDDITEYVYKRDQITITRGRSDEGSEVNPTTARLTLNNRDGRFSPRNPTGAYYGLIGRNTPLRIAIREELGWLQINQATGNTITPTHVSTTDKAALDTTGDLDIRFWADLDSWRDAMELVSKWTETGDQRSYKLTLSSAGILRLTHSTDGTSGGSLSAASTVPVPITSGPIAVRVTLDVDSGGNRVRQFYVSDSIDGTWDELGDSTVATGTTSVFASTATLHILDNPNDTSFGSIIRGKIYGVQVRNGIAGTAVANPDFTIQNEGDTVFPDDAGNTWTLNGDLDLTNHDIRFTGEVSAWPQAWDTTGTDVYSTITASGPLRRLLQGSAIGSALYRGSVRDSDTIAYWSMEDGSNATAFGSASAGGRDIVPNSTTVFASNSDFACSDPLPVIGQGTLRARVLPYTSTGEILVAFLLLIPDAGLSATSTIATITCGGTATRWDLTYSTASGGSLSLLAYDNNDTLLDTLGPGGFAVNGVPLMLKIRLENSGSDVLNEIAVYKVGGTVSSAITDTVAGRQIGSVSSVVFNPLSFSEFDGVVVGHLSVTNTTDSVWTEIDQINAWNGETATDRVKRLAEEESVAFCPIGPRGDGDSVSMGFQRSDTLINLLREAAVSDGGILFEGREFLELRYRPRKAIQSQPSDLELSYTDHEMDTLEPVEDDQLTRNDVTVSRVNGGSARVEVTTGPLSTDIPPAGVGRYDTSVSVSLEDDSTLPDQASWRVHLGTVDEARYPRLNLLLESTHLAEERTTIHRIDLGDRLTITGSPAWLAQQDILQLVQGYTETMHQFHHQVEMNLSPARPWDVGVYDDHYERTRYANGDCTTTEALDTTETGVDVLTGSIGKRWSATAVPYDIMVGGEQMTVTAVTGATKSQTLTVTRSVNGVVKTHVSGVSVELYPISYYGL